MAIRFQADSDLRQHIVRAVRRREPAIDFQSAQAASLEGLGDLDVLKKAAKEGRILVSHDKRTMAKSLAGMRAEGSESPGIFLVIPQNVEIQRVVESLVLIWAASEPDEWRNLITKIPF